MQQFQAALAEGVPAESLIGILCAYPLENQTLGNLFFIEFFVDSFIGLVIWVHNRRYTCLIMLMLLGCS